MATYGYARVSSMLDVIRPNDSLMVTRIDRKASGCTFRRHGMTKEWIAVLKAADAAAKWHVHLRRKGASEEPYINHLLEVATLVAEATHGQDPDLVIAARLHDAIEDQEVPRAIIASAFGEAVAGLVEEVTDDKAIEMQKRKQLQVESVGGR